MALTFTKATRQAARLKLGVQGPSGSGKTLGALALAHGLAGDGRVAVIDTENGSASLYADRFDFDVLELTPPYTSARYIEALEAAVEAGYSVIVVDSLSHQWAGPGGILARKEAVDARGGNSYTNWAKFTKEHEDFKARLLALPAHVITTLRTKQDYVLEEKNGKSAPKKVGLAAIQREGMEYELSIVFELQMDHRATVSKDRTGLFDGELTDLCAKDTAQRLRAWLASGAPEVATPAPAPAAGDMELATEAQRDALRAYFTDERVPGNVANSIRRALASGISYDKAVDWLERLEKQFPPRAAARTVTVPADLVSADDAPALALSDERRRPTPANALED